MRYPASEKLEIIRLVEQSHLSVRRTLDMLGIPRTTFYRWYELYQAPDGQTCDRVFFESVEPGTPEAIWGDPDLFREFGGAGDAAIWTGVALNAFILRYLSTGTEADYLRMERKVQDGAVFAVQKQGILVGFETANQWIDRVVTKTEDRFDLCLDAAGMRYRCSGIVIEAGTAASGFTA